MHFAIDVLEMVHSLYACESCEEFVDLWNALVTMHEHNLIPDACWSIFSDSCDDLIFDCDPDVYRVVNTRYCV